VNELERSEISGQRSGTPKITGWHITTLVLLALGYSAYYFCRSDYSVALPLILAEQVKHGVDMRVAEVKLGSIASLGVLAYTIGKAPAGAIADRFGGRKNFLGGMLGSILFTLLFVVGGGLPIFTLDWIANRFIQSLGWPGLVKVTSRWFSHSVYGSVMAVLSLSYLFGDAISREIMSLLLEHGMGWRGLFVTGAAVLGFLFICNLIFLRESPTEYNLPPSEERPLIKFAHSDREANEVRISDIYRGLFSSSAFWLICFLSLGTTLLRETFNLWMPTYLSQCLGMNNARGRERKRDLSSLWRHLRALCWLAKRRFWSCRPQSHSLRRDCIICDCTCRFGPRAGQSLQSPPLIARRRGRILSNRSLLLSERCDIP